MGVGAVPARDLREHALPHRVATLRSQPAAPCLADQCRILLGSRSRHEPHPTLLGRGRRRVRQRERGHDFWRFLATLTIYSANTECKALPQQFQGRGAMLAAVTT